MMPEKKDRFGRIVFLVMCGAMVVAAMLLNEARPYVVAEMGIVAMGVLVVVGR